MDEEKNRKIENKNRKSLVTSRSQSIKENAGEQRWR